MSTVPEGLISKLQQLASGLADRPKLRDMFIKCFINTLETTTELCEDGTTFVFTGDIPAMWLRDSTAQVKHYLPLCNQFNELKVIIEGLIKRQVKYISIDGYANAFNKQPDGSGHQEDITEQSPWIWERKYEIDSLCYPVQLIYLYWKETEETKIFNEEIKKCFYNIIELWKKEQKHELSQYSFERTECYLPSDTLPEHGRGTAVGYTGMTWSGFRPSDDACSYGYLIPANMFAVVVLGYIIEIAEEIYGDTILATEAEKLKKEIEHGINHYGIYKHPVYGKIYAYETDGYGNYKLMDDANVPSLMSIPYLGYKPIDEEIYRNTRSFLLSENNPYYYEGKYARGIGSPHTPEGYIWPIALIMQALTSECQSEIDEILEILLSTDDKTGFMHESFNPDDPSEYTRAWFAWANSIFAELIYKELAN